MKAQNKCYEKIWRRFDDIDRKLMQIENDGISNSEIIEESANNKISKLYQKRIHMLPTMATGQYFVVQLVHRFGFDITEIASWCTLSPLLILGIYRGQRKLLSSDFVFEQLLRFYCVVLRHNLQPSLKTAHH